MKAFSATFVAALAVLAGTVSAQAAVSTCEGIGTTTTSGGVVTVAYGTCNTDENGGSGSVTFADAGATANLSAKTQRGAEQVASFWDSNGAITTSTGGVCVWVFYNSLSLKGQGVVFAQLNLSYNGAPQSRQTFSVIATGSQRYCAVYPVGASNVWWQLILLAGGDKPSGQAQVSATIDDVTAEVQL